MSHRRLIVALACALTCIGSGDLTAHPNDVLSRAQALRAQGSLTEAEAYLRARLLRLTPEERAGAHGLLGRIALAQGETARARGELEAGMTQQRSRGKISLALADGFALTFLEAEVAHDLERARRVLDELASIARDQPEDRAALAYHRALVAYKGEAPRQALALLSQARAEPVNKLPPSLARGIRTLYGSVLSSVGRFAEARALASESLALSANLSVCERSDAHATRGWFALLPKLAARPQVATEEVAAHGDFVTALSLAERCADPRRLGHATINLALSSLIERSDAHQAEAALTRFDALKLDGEAALHAWALQTRGRIHLSQGRLDAAHEAFTRELTLADAAGSDGWAYRALVGLGREQTARGHVDEALSMYRQAERRVARLAALAPLSSGHDAFFAQREDASLGVVQSLVALERHAEAEDAARSALSLATAEAGVGSRIEALPARDRERLRQMLRKYRALRDELDRESRDDWRLSSAALREASEARAHKQAALYRTLDAAHALIAPLSSHATAASTEPGTTHLTFYPALSEGARDRRWFLFVHDAQGAVRFVDLTLGGPIEASLVAELRALWPHTSGERVALHVHPALPLPDLHAIVLHGLPFNAHAQVVYAEGLGRSPAQGDSKTRALLVLDPTNTLTNIEPESLSVQRGFQAMGLETLVRREEHASRAQLLADLGTARYLHFAGHARPEGDTAMGSALSLALGQSLTAFDVLSVERTPSQVVLSACRAGASEHAALSLSRAFIAQGSREVMAATRAVDDDDAARIMAALYAELPDAGSLAEAFRRAVVKLEQEPKQVDWAAFRIFVR